MFDQGGQQLQEAGGLRSGVGVKQFLGLIHRQHQGRGGLLGGHIQQPGARYLRPPSASPATARHGRVAGGLDLPQQRLRQSQIGAQPVDGVRETEFAGQHRAFRAHDGQG